MAKARDYSDRDKKKLYALSGNECANPICHTKLVNPDENAKDDQICHIEAASPDGPRYNPTQTDDERRSFDNLILLCHKCHDMIDNNPDIYTVEILKQWKREHEAKLTDIIKNKVFSFSIPQGLLLRDKEADNLYDAIISNRFFNLVGVGGSGKSSLAYLMLQKHEDDFNEIAYVVINNNIKEDIALKVNSIVNVVKNEEDKKYEKIITYLDANFKSTNPNLLVLDINETAQDETDKTTAKELKTIINNWNVLVISREQFKGFKSLNLNYNEDISFLKELFLEKAGREKYKNFGQFDELFKTICYSPILAEQLGLYLQALPIKSLDEIKAIFFDDNFREEELENRNDTIISFLKKLIDYNKFKDNEKEVLRHLVLWPTDYIEYNVIKTLMNGIFDSESDFNNAIVNLSRRAILTQKELPEGNTAYKLHGLLADSLRKQIDIKKQDYSAYLSNIDADIELDYYESTSFAKCIGHSLSNYNITDDYNNWLRAADVGMVFGTSIYSLILYKKCIDYFSKLNDVICLSQKKDLLAILLNISELLIEEKEYKMAEKNLQQAMIIEEELSKTSTNQSLLSDIYKRIAELQINYLNKYESAAHNLQKAIKIKELLPISVTNQITIAELCTNLAILQYKHLNNPPLADINFKKAIEICETISNYKDSFIDWTFPYISILHNAYHQYSLFLQHQKMFIESELYNNKASKILLIIKEFQEKLDDYTRKYKSSQTM